MISRALRLICLVLRPCADFQCNWFIEYESVSPRCAWNGLPKMVLDDHYEASTYSQVLLTKRLHDSSYSTR